MSVSTLAYLGPLASTYTASGTEWYTFSISTLWCNSYAFPDRTGMG